MNIGVILAGGTGSRVGTDLPKQFYKIAGKMVIEHTLEVFQNHREIDEIVVVSNPEYINEVENICIRNEFTKLKKILKGGKERYQSSLAAIYAYETYPEANLLFHDAVRPLVNERIISEVISALDSYNAVDVAIKTTDTIIQVSNKDKISGVPDRSILRSGQTPQGFKLRTIKRAYEIALQDPEFKTTDDCGVVFKYLPEEDVFVVNGEIFNLKLTYKEDIPLIDKLFQLKSLSFEQSKNQLRISQKEKDKLKNKIIVVFGGSSGIGADIVKICKDYKIKVYSFSRSTTNTDITDYKCVQIALNKVSEIEGRIDYVINTAGILFKIPLVHMDYSEVEKIINTNFLGSVIVAKESFRYLKESKGALLLYTSSSYTKGRAMYSLYSSTKAAIVNLTQALSEEWDKFDIRVNCVNPERTKTPMRVRNFGDEPTGSLLSSEKVAIGSLFALLSDLTGEVFDIKIK